MTRSSTLILFTQYNKSYPTFVPNFKILGAAVPEKSLTQIFLCIILEREIEKNENWKKKAKINHSILVFYPTIYLAPLKVYIKFEDSGSHRSLDFCDIIFLLERAKNGQIKGTINRRRLNLFYTIQQVIPNICTKLQNPRCSSS